MSILKSLKPTGQKGRQILIKIVCTNGKPTLFFMINDIMKQMLLLDGSNNKNLRHAAFESFKVATQELFIYEI